MHINGIIHLSTSIQLKAELRSLLCLELQLLEVPSYRPCLSCSRFKLLLYCCEGTNPQYHRYVGAVGFQLKYPQTKYNAPTDSSSCGRSGIKTHVVMFIFTNHMTQSSVQVCKRVGPPLIRYRSVPLICPHFVHYILPKVEGGAYIRRCN